MADEYVETEGYSGNDGYGDNEFTETSHEGIGSRLGNSIAGVCIGIVLFLGAFPLLWWNEGRAVDAYEAIKEGRKTVISINSTSIDPANEGKLVHLSGLAEPTDNITDPEFNVEVSNMITLNRNVEMYQWYEEKSTRKEKQLGGGEKTVTTYTYVKKWSGTEQSSSNFKKPEGRDNPPMRMFSEKFLSSSVILGAFTLPDDLISYLAVDNNYDGSLPTDTIPSDNILQQKIAAKSIPYGYYFGASTSAPAVGDYEVTYTGSEGGVASIIAQQQGSSFVKYTAASGGTLYRLDRGTVSADEMFDAAKAENKMLTMILRFVGAIVMAIGIGMVLSPLEVVADVIPCIGDIVGGAISCVSGLIAAVLSLIVIGIAWVANRPIILGVAVGGLAIVGFLVYRMRSTKKKPEGEPDIKVESYGA